MKSSEILQRAKDAIDTLWFAEFARDWARAWDYLSDFAIEYEGGRHSNRLVTTLAWMGTILSDEAGQLPERKEAPISRTEFMKVLDHVIALVEQEEALDERPSS